MRVIRPNQWAGTDDRGSSAIGTWPGSLMSWRFRYSGVQPTSDEGIMITFGTPMLMPCATTKITPFQALIVRLSYLSS